MSSFGDGFGDRVYQLFGWRRQEPEAMILWLGLDGCGKSALLKRCLALKTNYQGLEDNLDRNAPSSGSAVTIEEITPSLPTQGYEIKSMELFGMRIVAWDVGGQKTLRHTWRKYFTGATNVDVLVYVIDSSDRRRIAETGITLRQLLDEDRLSGVPLLIFANKQDVSTALTPLQLVRAV